MKSTLISIASNIGAWQVRKSRQRNAIVIPPAGPGSVGDAAMLGSTIQALRRRGFEKVDILQVQAGVQWDLDSPADRLIPAAKFIDYGSRVNLAAILLQLRSYSDLFCIGADILDGIYDEDRMAHRLELIHRAALMGLTATIIGSSFSEQPSPRCVDLISSLPDGVRIFARDEFSLRRMSLAFKREVALSADVAFMLETASTTASNLPEMNWIRSERASGRRIISINANYLHEKNRPSFIDDYTRLSAELINQGASLLMLPHDLRTERSDEFISKEIMMRLDPSCAGRTCLLTRRMPGQVKALLADVDLLITGRMHAAIIALGSNTPALSFAYANKFEGLYRHLDLDPAEMILSLDELHSDAPSVVAQVMEALDRAPQLRGHIEGKMGELKEAAARNFDQEWRAAA